jgi:hypothetical protein
MGQSLEPWDIDCVMATEPNNEDKAAASAAAVTPVVSLGFIKDVVKFETRISDKVRALCAEHRSWASREAVELFLFIVDEYLSMLEIDASTYDVGDLRKAFTRYVNMNACNNRYAEAKLIDRNEKGSRKIHSDLL